MVSQEAHGLFHFARKGNVKHPEDGHDTADAVKQVGWLADLSK